MGYRRNKKVYKLRFEDPEMDGLVVRATSAPLGMFMELASLADLDLSNPSNISGDDVEQVNKLFEMFAQYLVDWNLEDDEGEPVPATMDGLLTQDIDFVMQIIEGWMTAIASVPAPKGRPSPAGRQFPEGSLPMEPLSPSLPSWPMPNSSSDSASGLDAFRVSS